jgi:6-phosphofructokinase 1
MSTSSSQGRLGILVGGGPAPGINGVISAVTIEAIEEAGLEVYGFMDGFKHLVKGDATQWRKLTIDEVKSINLRGGSILRTSRTNPTKKEEYMRNTLDVFRKLNITRLVTIGGDDTAYSGSQVHANAAGAIRVAHVPKTIDNDLPLPGSTPTFGFETARHIGFQVARNLAEDARTTSRWYIIVTMGRTTGHLALGIGKAAAATVTIIPEEFEDRKVTLDEVCDIILGSIIKRKMAGNDYGVAILAEGLLESIGEEGLQDMIKSGMLARYGKLEWDEFKHLRLGLIDSARMIKDLLAERVKPFKLDISLMDKEIGYELRCADPIPFDAEYTRDLGYGAVKFLLSEESAQYGAMVTFVGGKLYMKKFQDILTTSNRMETRKVEVKGEGYEVALRYMIRLEKRDFTDPKRISRLAETANMSIDDFKARFEYLVRDDAIAGSQ